jgi:hypothetical protein
MNLAKRHKLVSVEQITLIVTRAVESEGVKLARVVPAVHQAVRAPATRVEPSRDDVSRSASPLALNAQQTGPKIKDQVIPLVVEGPCNTDTQFERARRDLRLSERAFLIRRQHGQHYICAIGRTVAAKGNVSV